MGNAAASVISLHIWHMARKRIFIHRKIETNTHRQRVPQTVTHRQDRTKQWGEIISVGVFSFK